MIKISSINPDELTQYARYIFYLTSMIDKAVELSIVRCDDKKYIVAMDGPVTAFVEDVNDNLEGFATVMNNEGQIVCYFDEEFRYEINIDREEPIVTRISLRNAFMDQVYIKLRKDNQPHDYLSYYVRPSSGDMELQIRYDVTRFIDNIPSFFYYLDCKEPDGFYLDVHQRILFLFKRKKHEWFLKMEDEGNYGKMIVDLPINYIPVYSTHYTLKDVREYLDAYGLPYEIPQDMRDMFLGNDERIKKLELLSQEYRKFYRS